MQIVHERCCGLASHKRLVVACLITPGPGGARRKEVRRFGTMTADLLALADWLAAAGCTQVAMESTGVYWKPIVNVLDGVCEVVVANAQHIKGLPGRKTDQQDAEWIADLLQHGMLPRSRHHRGVGGHAGETDAHRLAGLARGKLRAKHEQLEQALTGYVRPHHRFLLAEHLSHPDYLDAAIERLNAEIGRRRAECAEEIALLDSVPGIGLHVARGFLAEVGADLSRFPSAGHLASWAGLCPGHHESAGKRKSGKTRKGSPWLRQLLVEAAQAAVRQKHSYLSARYRRLAAGVVPRRPWSRWRTASW
jgi:transposase